MNIRINIKDIILIPNLISLLRILLIIPVIVLMRNFEVNKHIIISLGLIAVFLDNLDGFLARKLNQISELGKILDPIADKLLIAIFTIGLYLNNLLPFWFLCIIILRDLIIILGSLYFVKKINKITPSNRVGKFTVFFIFITLFISLLEIGIFNQVKLYFYLFTSILMFYNLIDYYLRIKKLINLSL